MTAARHPCSTAIEAFADDLAKLDTSTAHAVIDEARHMARAHWLAQQIREGEESGEPIDGPTAMAELLVEAEADIQARA